ncbi:charged multivesicular body protein 7-like [Scaptodrosophila lebanonensis]|uniref:Charged multivesicular body protein 7-like n=1 Tax=Drosophila lebanonensis TaxID=7225 RepID=A0A6J2UB77_DROLE|nr:charged multivesicular body protein 7-like [Scaptodrosophila lebanonensis]
MRFLFSSVRSRGAENAENEKTAFWRHLIGKYCQFLDTAIFSQRELQSWFMRGDQSPACLDLVIAKMQQTREIRARSDYENELRSTWHTWALNIFVKRPLSWAWQKLWHNPISEDLKWVHLNTLKIQCDSLENKVLKYNRGKLLYFEAFEALCSTCDLKIHSESLALCLQTLHTRKGLGLKYKDGKQKRLIHLIKIPEGNDANMDITELDLALHRLQMTKTSLLQQMEKLEDECKFNDKKVHQYVKENKRQLAKVYLRRRHLVEKNHERRGMALLHVEKLFANVVEAQNNGFVFDAYKIGTKALQKVLNDCGLNFDNIAEVLTDTHDILEQHRELQTELANEVVVFAEEEDLEAELRNINDEASKEITDWQTNAMLDMLKPEEEEENGSDIEAVSQTSATAHCSC